MSNKVLKPLEPFLKETKETSTGLVLVYRNFNQKAYSYSFDVLAALTVVNTLKIKIKYKGKKYYIKSFSQQEIRENASLSFLGQSVATKYLSKPSSSSLTIILDEIL